MWYSPASFLEGTQLSKLPFSREKKNLLGQAPKCEEFQLTGFWQIYMQLETGFANKWCWANTQCWSLSRVGVNHSKLKWQRLVGLGRGRTEKGGGRNEVQEQKEKGEAIKVNAKSAEQVKYER